jgi:hypothetical protein
VVVPTNEHFQIVRAEAKELGKVHERHRMVSAMQAAAAKCDRVHEGMVRLAEFRLQLERDLGAYLAQVVTRGGHRSKSLRSTLLPPGVTRNQSSTYQLLAAIPRRCSTPTLKACVIGAGCRPTVVRRPSQSSVGRVVKTKRLANGLRPRLVARGWLQRLMGQHNPTSK